jgi:hypothetical protein
MASLNTDTPAYPVVDLSGPTVVIQFWVNHDSLVPKGAFEHPVRDNSSGAAGQELLRIVGSRVGVRSLVGTAHEPGDLVASGLVLSGLSFSQRPRAQAGIHYVVRATYRRSPESEDHTKDLSPQDLHVLGNMHYWGDVRVHRNANSLICLDFSGRFSRVTPDMRIQIPDGTKRGWIKGHGTGVPIQPFHHLHVQGRQLLVMPGMEHPQHRVQDSVMAGAT